MQKSSCKFGQIRITLKRDEKVFIRKVCNHSLLSDWHRTLFKFNGNMNIILIILIVPSILLFSEFSLHRQDGFSIWFWNGNNTETIQYIHTFSKTYLRWEINWLFNKFDLNWDYILSMNILWKNIIPFETFRWCASYIKFSYLSLTVIFQQMSPFIFIQFMES